MGRRQMEHVEEGGGVDREVVVMAGAPVLSAP